MTKFKWRAWRNDYYDRLSQQSRNVRRMKTYAPATAARKTDWSGEVDAAASYYSRVVVPASDRLGGGEFDPALAEKVIAEAPSL